MKYFDVCIPKHLIKVHHEAGPDCINPDISFEAARRACRGLVKSWGFGEVITVDFTPVDTIDHRGELPAAYGIGKEVVPHG